MLEVRCDHCGCFLDKEANRIDVKRINFIRACMYITGETFGETESHVLCDDCRIALNEWLNAKEV